jgi:flagellar basal body-associated protein FliL
MISIPFKRLAKSRKVQIITAVVVLVLVLGGATAFLLTRGKTATTKKASTAIITKKETLKTTATTEDVQSDLNTINSKSSGLDTAVDGTNNALSEQPADLGY